MLDKVFSFIENVRTWPEEDRRHLAYVLAGGISAMVVVLWLLLLPVIINVPKTEQDKKLTAAVSKLPGIGQLFGQQLSGVRESVVEGLADYAQQPKEESANNTGVPVNEAGVTPVEFPAPSALEVLSAP